jgi:hypothetical protein
MSFAAIVLLGSLSSSVQAHAVDNGLARTPAMGWISWSRFRCENLNEKRVRQTADAVATNGMRDAGYQYVVLDDCWQSSRDAQGNNLDNGDPCSHEDYKGNRRMTLNGLCLAMVQSTAKAGNIRITASSPKLRSDSVTIVTRG